MPVPLIEGYKNKAEEKNLPLLLCNTSYKFSITSAIFKARNREAFYRLRSEDL